MNKNEFVAEVASKTGLTKKDALAAVEATFGTITETLSKGDSVSIAGFGAFQTSQRAARVAKVPGTQREVQVPAQTVAKFKPAKGLKETLKK